MEWDINKI